MVDFKKYFILPLVHDEYATCMVWDSDDNRAFDFCISDEETQKRIVNKLNGKEKKRVDNELMFGDGYVYADGEKLLFVRSWGRLTGTGGGLGLKHEKAAEIQDEFCKWIIETLKTKEE